MSTLSSLRKKSKKSKSKSPTSAEKQLKSEKTRQRQLISQANEDLAQYDYDLQSLMKKKKRLKQLELDSGTEEYEQQQQKISELEDEIQFNKTQKKETEKKLEELKDTYKVYYKRRKFNRQRVGVSLTSLLKKANKIENIVEKLNKSIYQPIHFHGRRKFFEITPRLYFVNVATDKKTIYSNALIKFVLLYDICGLCDLPFVSKIHIKNFLINFAGSSADKENVELNQKVLLFLDNYLGKVKPNFKTDEFIFGKAFDPRFRPNFSDTEKLLDERQLKHKQYIKIFELINNKQKAKIMSKQQNLDYVIGNLKAKDLKTIAANLNVIFKYSGQKQFSTQRTENLLRGLNERLKKEPLFLEKDYVDDDNEGETMSIFAQQFAFPSYHSPNNLNDTMHKLIFFPKFSDKTISKDLFLCVLACLMFQIRKVSFRKLSLKQLMAQRSNLLHHINQISSPDKGKLKKLNNASNKLFRSVLGITFAKYMIQKNALKYQKSKNLFGLSPVQRRKGRFTLKFDQRELAKFETALANINTLFNRKMNKKYLGKSFLRKDKTKFEFRPDLQEELGDLEGESLENKYPLLSKAAEVGKNAFRRWQESTDSEAENSEAQDSEDFSEEDSEDEQGADEDQKKEPESSWSSWINQHFFQ